MDFDLIAIGSGQTNVSARQTSSLTSITCGQSSAPPSPARLSMERCPAFRLRFDTQYRPSVASFASILSVSGCSLILLVHRDRPSDAKNIAVPIHQRAWWRGLDLDFNPLGLLCGSAGAEEQGEKGEENCARSDFHLSNMVIQPSPGPPKV